MRFLDIVWTILYQKQYFYRIIWDKNITCFFSFLKTFCSNFETESSERIDLFFFQKMFEPLRIPQYWLFYYPVRHYLKCQVNRLKAVECQIFPLDRGKSKLLKLWPIRGLAGWAHFFLLNYRRLLGSPRGRGRNIFLKKQKMRKNSD